MKTAARLFVITCVLSIIQSASVHAQAPVVNICLVTVDSSSTHNIVVWEKPITEVIDSFLVYRMFPDSIYYEVGSVHYDSLSIFHDYDANADPNTNKHRYKLATLDTAGVTSALSNYHQTMHLTVSTVGNMFWSWYKIEGANNPVSMFNCYRDDNGTGDFQIVNVAAGNIQAWNDNDFGLYPSSRYVVDVDWSVSCDASRENVNTTRSNLDERVDAPPVGIDESLIDDIKLYPNPTEGPICLQIPTGLKANGYILWSSLGAVSYSQNLPNYGSNGLLTMDLPALVSGVYFLELSTDLGVVTKKLIVR